MRASLSRLRAAPRLQAINEDFNRVAAEAATAEGGEAPPPERDKTMHERILEEQAHQTRAPVEVIDDYSSEYSVSVYIKSNRETRLDKIMRAAPPYDPARDEELGFVGEYGNGEEDEEGTLTNHKDDGMYDDDHHHHHHGAGSTVDRRVSKASEMPSTLTTETGTSEDTRSAAAPPGRGRSRESLPRGGKLPMRR